MRTGWLNQLNQGQTRQTCGLEGELLGGTFDKDPFRLVKVSDMIPVGNPETRICFAVNKKKKYQPASSDSDEVFTRLWRPFYEIGISGANWQT